MKAALAFCFALVGLGCAGTPLPRDLEQAQILERGGHDEAALAAWRDIRLACLQKGPRPHDDCGLAALREAELLERLERYPEAAAAWEALPTRTTDDTKAARGLMRAADINWRRLRQSEHARQLAWQCVERYPNEIGADTALRWPSVDTQNRPLIDT